jgi:hypothetical protein
MRSSLAAVGCSWAESENAPAVTPLAACAAGWLVRAAELFRALREDGCGVLSRLRGAGSGAVTVTAGSWPVPDADDAVCASAESIHVMDAATAEAKKRQRIRRNALPLRNKCYNNFSAARNSDRADNIN